MVAAKSATKTPNSSVNVNPASLLFLFRGKKRNTMNHSTIKIAINDIEEFAKVCASLVKEGVLFNACLKGNEWVIEFTGGF
jgi:hypothetical protein